MKRGTNVGAVYVAATVDASGMNEDIVDGVDSAGNDIDKLGDEHGERYGDNFGEALDERLSKSMDKLGDKLSRRLSTRLGKGLKEAFSDDNAKGLGGRLGDALGEVLADRVEQTLAGIEDRIAGAVNSVSGNSGGGTGGSGGGGAGPGSPSFPSQGPNPDRDAVVWAAAKAMNDKFDRERTALLARAFKADEAFDKARFLMVEHASALNDKFDRDRGLLMERALAMNEKFDRAQGLMLDRAIEMNEKFDRAQTLMLERAHTLNEKFDRDRGLLLERAQAMNDKFDRDQGLMLDRAERMNEAFDRTRTLMLERAYAMNAKIDQDREDNVQREGRNLEAAHRMNLAFDRARTKMLAEAYRLNAGFDKGKIGGDGRSTGKESDSLGDRLGNLLGQGSRNNFLNVFGASVANVINLGEKATKTFSTFGKSLVKTFNEADTVAGGLRNVASSLGGSIASLGGTIVSMGAGFVAVLPLLSLFASALSGIIGIVAALAATITTGLVGALSVGAGALGAFIFAAGATTLAFKGMNQAQRDLLKDSFRPLKNEFLGLGQIMARDLVPRLVQFSDITKKAIVPLEPLFRKLGDAVGGVAVGFAQALRGSNFVYFFDQLGNYLPSIISKFGSAINNTLSGLAGVFGVLQPYIEDFASYLDRVTTRFDNFVASAKGRTAIEGFFDRATAAARDLGDFLGELGGLLSDVLFGVSGNEAGSTIFDGLTRSIGRFRAYIADGGLEEWFREATTFASSLGSVMASVGAVFSALVTDGSIQILNTLLDALAGFLTLLTPLISAVLLVMEPLAHFIGVLADAFGGLDGRIKLVGLALPVLAFGLSSLSNTLAPYAALFAGFSLATRAGESDLKLFGGTALAVAGGLAIAGPIGGAVAGAIALFSGLFQNVKNASGATKEFQESLSNASIGNYASSVKRLTDEATRLYEANREATSGSDFEVGLKGVFGDLDTVAGNLASTTAELDKFNDKLQSDADRLGLFTGSLKKGGAGWEEFTYYTLEARAALVDTASVLDSLGYDIDEFARKTISLNNSLLDLGPALNLSPDAINQLRFSIDSIRPDKLDSITARIQSLKTAITFEQFNGSDADVARAVQAYQDFINKVISKIDSGALTDPALLSDIGGTAAASVEAAKEWKNPYVAYANSIIKDGPTVAATIANALNTANSQITKAMRSSNSSFAQAIRGATNAVGGDDVMSALRNLVDQQQASAANLVDSLRTNAENAVSTAQSAVNSAASTLAGASSQEAANSALDALHNAQAQLAQANNAQDTIYAQAAAYQAKINKVNAILSGQSQLTLFTNAKKNGGYRNAAQYLAAGFKFENATLTDFAQAREIVAAKLEAAKARLEAAITLRDDFAKSVSDSAKNFAAIMTAQAQVIDGVEQKLTSSDIISNLRDKFSQLRAYSENMRRLLSLGLSKDAYRQLISQGPEAAAEYAQALVDGGIDSVSTVNGLVGQINGLSNSLGDAASTRLYQSGVDAARGLVAGLESLSGRLDSAAARLGRQIARAIERELDIHSPSRKAIKIMDRLGDGMVIGLDKQQRRVGAASTDLARAIDISPKPDGTGYSTYRGSGGSGVSGNSGSGSTKDVTINVHTPNDPKTVANEIMAGVVPSL